ncbi:DNA-directed RNA polymerase subunit G [Staphylothermus hellenicus]|nr:DNA-directed RNA polymerase subunit G [Staphylothermus hellenicus]
MVSYECKVKSIEPLRYIGMYRAISDCDGVEITLEMNEKLMKISEGDNLVINISTNKEECLQHYFCGKGHVVSITKLDNIYRVVVSVAGILAVLKMKQRPRSPFKVMNELYIGVSKK